jgi:hypothetical protein
MPKTHCSNCGKNHYYDFGESSFRCPYCGCVYIWSDIKMILKLVIAIIVFLSFCKIANCLKPTNEQKVTNQSYQQNR